MNHVLMCLALFLSVSAFLPMVFAAQEGAKEEFDGSSAKLRDAKKTTEDPTCVFPKVKNAAAILEYVKGKLAEAGAPKELDVSIFFNQAFANVKLVASDAQEFPISWKLPPNCEGEITWLSDVSPGSPQWLGKLRSVEFVSGVPLTPKKVASFQGESYVEATPAKEPSSAPAPLTGEGGNSSDEDRRVPIGLAVVAAALLLWVLRGVFQKKEE